LSMHKELTDLEESSKQELSQGEITPSGSPLPTLESPGPKELSGPSMENTPEKVYFEPTQSIEHEVKSAPLQLSKVDGAKDATENVSENVSEDVTNDVTTDVTADVTTDVTKDEKNDEDSSSDSGLKSECSKAVSHEYDSELTVEEEEVEDITSSRIDVRCKDPTLEDKKSEMKSEVTNVSGATVTENVTPDVTTKEVVETNVTKDVTTESKNLDSSVEAVPSMPVESDVTTPVTNVETNVTKVDKKDAIADSKSECSSELNQQQTQTTPSLSSSSTMIIDNVESTTSIESNLNQVEEEKLESVAKELINHTIKKSFDKVRRGDPTYNVTHVIFTSKWQIEYNFFQKQTSQVETSQKSNEPKSDEWK